MCLPGSHPLAGIREREGKGEKWAFVTRFYINISGQLLSVSNE